MESESLIPSDNVDYALIEYDNVKDYKGESDYHVPLVPGSLNKLVRLLARPRQIQR